MMQQQMFRLIVLAAMLLLQACQINGEQEKVVHREAQSSVLPSEFGSYWYQGKAELTHYRLEQARYGEIRKGDAVLIFVTEDFLAKAQVKYEYGKPAEPVVKVLKLNSNRRFFTGIYPYSTLTSVFTPVYETHQHSLKLSNSVQEWCGHVYGQLNLRNEHYELDSHSYFQKEADQRLQLPISWTEDELWTKLRLNPDLLPTGEVNILPSLLYLRLRHKPFELQKAVAKFSNYDDPTLSPGPLKVYELKYQTIKRELKIVYEVDFPYKIVMWEEKVPGANDWLVTRGTKTHELLLDYWNKNSEADSLYRKSLGM
jgi:hypothetical protein